MKLYKIIRNNKSGKLYIELPDDSFFTKYLGQSLHPNEGMQLRCKTKKMDENDNTSFRFSYSLPKLEEKKSEKKKEKKKEKSEKKKEKSEKKENFKNENHEKPMNIETQNSVKNLYNEFIAAFSSYMPIEATFEDFAQLDFSDYEDIKIETQKNILEKARSFIKSDQQKNISKSEHEQEKIEEEKEEEDSEKKIEIESENEPESNSISNTEITIESVRKKVKKIEEDLYDLLSTFSNEEIQNFLNTYIKDSYGNNIITKEEMRLYIEYIPTIVTEMKEKYTNTKIIYPKDDFMEKIKSLKLKSEEEEIINYIHYNDKNFTGIQINELFDKIHSIKKKEILYHIKNLVSKNLLLESQKNTYTITNL